MNINNFGPFHADVWGTTSDWAMVLVTSITLFLIFRTFRSQLIVQKAQQRMLTIENEKYRNTILPEFDLEILKHSIEKKGDVVLTVVLVMVRLKKNAAKQVTVEFVSQKSVFIKSKTKIHIDGHLDERASQPLSLTLSTEKGEFDSDGTSFSCFITFCDMIGNKYEKTIVCNIEYTGINISNTFSPELLV